MAAPQYWESKVLLAKLETTYATDPTPTGDDNGILATAVTLRPMEGEDISRELERSFLGAQEVIPAGLYSVLEFDTELAGSGTAGTAPAWGPLARMCALAETIEEATSVMYSPFSDKATYESGAIYIWIDGTKYVLLGARGTCEMRVDAQQIPKLHWTFTGLFKQPTATAQATPDVSSFKAPLIATKVNTPTFTVNSVPLVLRSFRLNVGNDVQRRLLIGRDEVLIVDKKETISMTVEATALGTFNPYALATPVAGVITLVPISLVHGTAAGNIATLSAPTSQIKRQAGLENNQKIVEWPLEAMPQPDEGDDQWTLTLT